MKAFRPPMRLTWASEARADCSRNSARASGCWRCAAAHAHAPAKERLSVIIYADSLLVGVLLAHAHAH